MKIRTRLLLLIVPTVLAVIITISFFSLEVIDRKAHETEEIILLGAAATIILIMIGVAFIAKNISHPVEQLKNAALTLAAGNYGKKIEVKGPQEITELANTLNIMSECLREHLQRLQESSLLREKMIGEVECVRILQSKLVQDIAESFSHPVFCMKSISISSKIPNKASVLEITENREKSITLRFKESNLPGFEGIYELIQAKETVPYPKIELSLSAENTHWQLNYRASFMPAPLIWSAKKSEIHYAKNGSSIEANDFIILVNPSLNELIQGDDKVHHWFSRVFHHFAEEGIDACSQLLTNELAFLSKRHEPRTCLQAICIYAIA